MYREQLLTFIAITFIILMLPGCQQPLFEDPTVIVDIDDEFYVDFWEVLGADNRSFVIQLSTIEEEDCQNATIDYVLHNSNKLIKVTINDILDPPDCEEGKATAKSNAEVGIIQEGIQEFQVNLKNTTVINKGQLLVSKDSYQVEMETTNGIAFLHEKLLRVPSQTIWGQISGDDIDEIASNFLADLSELTRDEKFIEGYYGHFEVQDDNHILLPIEPKFDQHESFILSYIGTTVQLHNLLEQYREMHGEAIDIQLFTWEGENI